MSDAGGGGGRERIADRSDKERIGEVMMTCVFHWRMRDVPDDRIREMEEEIEGHLQEAVSNGRSVEEVVGEDFAAFAEEWAEEARVERSFFGWAYEIGWALTFGIVFVAAVYHLFQWSLSFGVEAGMSVPVMVIVWTATVFRISVAAKGQRNEPEWTRRARGLAMVPVFFVPFAIAWAITGDRNTELFEWSWSYTLVALIAALVLGRLGKRSVGQK